MVGQNHLQSCSPAPVALLLKEITPAHAVVYRGHNLSVLRFPNLRLHRKREQDEKKRYKTPRTATLSIGSFHQLIDRTTGVGPFQKIHRYQLLNPVLSRAGAEVSKGFQLLPSNQPMVLEPDGTELDFQILRRNTGRLRGLLRPLEFLIPV